MMKRRKLGQSGIEASVVGLGAWAMGGWMWGGTDENESIKAVHAALDSGINLIDTAPIYGFGVSEEIIGKAIEGRRDDVVLATKCTMVTNTTHGVHKFNSDARGPNPNGHIAVQIYADPSSIRQEVEASLKRLKTDRIDLYQTHWQDTSTPIEETMSALLDLKKEGKIRAIGACNASVDELREYQKVGVLDSDQEKYSMLDRGLEQEQLPFCQHHHVAVLAYSPLARGLLTGKISADRVFAEGDQRRNDERFRVAYRERVNTMLGQFEPVAKRHGITLTQLAIAWTFHQPGLTHALCGARNPKQAQENAQAGSVELTSDDLKQLEDAMQRADPAAA